MALVAVAQVAAAAASVAHRAAVAVLPVPHQEVAPLPVPPARVARSIPEPVPPPAVALLARKRPLERAVALEGRPAQVADSAKRQAVAARSLAPVDQQVGGSAKINFEFLLPEMKWNSKNFGHIFEIFLI